LAAEITPPDYALRKNILLSKMRRDGIVLSDEIVDFIAANVRDSVRDLEGILASLLAHSTLTDKEIDLPLAEKVVSHIVALQPQTISIEDVMDAVSKHYNVSEKAIMAQNRSRDISMARHVAVYLCKQMTDYPLDAIGALLGGRDHSTIIHGANKIADEIAKDTVLQAQIDTITKKINPN
jgi:chromosomal replication initiator protein